MLQKDNKAISLLVILEYFFYKYIYNFEDIKTSVQTQKKLINVTVHAAIHKRKHSTRIIINTEYSKTVYIARYNRSLINHTVQRLMLNKSAKRTKFYYITIILQ